MASATSASTRAVVLAPDFFEYCAAFTSDTPVRHENKMRTSSQWGAEEGRAGCSAIDAGQPRHDSKFPEARYSCPPLSHWSSGKVIALGKSGPSHSASTRKFASMSYRDQQSLLGEIVMVEPGSPLLAFSDHAAELVERTAGNVVAVQGGGRWPSS